MSGQKDDAAQQKDEQCQIEEGWMPDEFVEAAPCERAAQDHAEHEGAGHPDEKSRHEYSVEVDFFSQAF